MGCAAEVAALAGLGGWRGGGGNGDPAHPSAHPTAGELLLALLGAHPRLVEHAVAALPAAVAGTVSVVVPVPVLAQAVPPDVPGGAGWAGSAASVGGWLRETGRVTVTGRKQVPAEPPSGLSGILRGVSTLDPDRGSPPGTVRVVAVTRPGGHRSWIVQIPGTQTLSPRATSDPFDLTGDFAAMANRPTACQRLVESALREAGARPAEPVLLAGHSEGGIIAAQLAADPKFRASHCVTHVVVAGAPVASMRVPDRVAVLALEHDEDFVPRLDGAPNPDRAGWATVSRSITPVGATPDPGAAHGLSAYAETAAAVDASTDPGLASWRQGLQPFLAGPGVTASGLEVTGVREIGP